LSIGPCAVAVPWARTTTALSSVFAHCSTKSPSSPFSETVRPLASSYAAMVALWWRLTVFPGLGAVARVTG
jgi:hypothetical protein